MNVLLLNGSSAQSSHTSALLRHLARLLQTKGCETEMLDLQGYGLPFNNPIFHADASASDNPTVREFASKIASSQLIVLGTPLYHGSFSGLIKAALDNLNDDALLGKKILIVSNSSGLRNSQQAAQQLVLVARTMYGSVHYRLIGTGKADYIETDNGFELTSQELLDRCQAIVDEMIA